MAIKYVAPYRMNSKQDTSQVYTGALTGREYKWLKEKGWTRGDRGAFGNTMKRPGKVSYRAARPAKKDVNKKGYQPKKQQRQTNNEPEPTPAVDINTPPWRPEGGS